jgi:short-subunit dehydrogenase
VTESLAGRRALVTGASSGIGAAIARELAARGADLVVTARRRAALDRLAGELATAHRVRVDVVVGDLGRAGAAAEVWAAATAGGSVDLLVNNAGFGYFARFGDAELARDGELVQLNVASLVELSQRFVVAARERARAGAPAAPARLLNIASIAAYQSVPLFAVYAASKAFVRNFTEALHDELRGSAISATCVCPGGTHTDFHAVAGAGDYGWLANASMLSAEAVAAISVRAMLAGRRTVVPGLLNKLSCFSVRLVPRVVASWVAGRVLGKPRGALPPRAAA